MDKLLLRSVNEFPVILLFLLLFLWKDYVVRKIYYLLKSKGDELYFFSLQSSSKDLWNLYLLNGCNQGMYYILFVLTLIMLSPFIQISIRWPVLVGLGILLVSAMKFFQKYQQGQILFLEQLQQFLFIYEQQQILGVNLYNALHKSKEEIVFLEYQSQVEDYRKSFDHLYQCSKWVVVKRIGLLIERNEHFASQELSLLFLDISEELHTQYVAQKKLHMEKLENRMLLPMMINMLLMIAYMIAPFVIEFWKGGSR